MNEKPVRPKFPSRAVVTAGMPYGNKELHFGHVGGVFVHADIFARFLRNRIGKDNVIFVSGTDCYGSSIVEKYRALKDENAFSGSITDFVRQNHEKQKATLQKYLIDISLFAASSLDRAGEIHERLSAEWAKRLYEAGALIKSKTAQFFDEAQNTFLNGRQVRGICPIDGCKSEEAYADECSLGHQYPPSDLINPVSTLSGRRPVLREVTNWYFDLEKYGGFLSEYVDTCEAAGTRKAMNVISRDYLRPPSVFVKDEVYAGGQWPVASGQFSKDGESKSSIPNPEPRTPNPDCPLYSVEPDEKRKIVKLTFNNLAEREHACAILTQNNIRFRTGKTLVPFRLSGNIEWGVPFPEFEGEKGLTFWVWPESLWAPISFTRAYLESIGAGEDEWKNYWCSSEAKAYQFIGEDNIYFYNLAEPAMFAALRGDGEWEMGNEDRELNKTAYEPRTPNPEPRNSSAYPPPTTNHQPRDHWPFQMPRIVANKHALFLDGKASSSGKVKPPMADELLSHYAPEQLRAHFFGMTLANMSVSFRPKAYDPKFSGDVDPATKEWNIFVNLLNRAVRTFFYSFQKCNGGNQNFPKGIVSDDILKKAGDAILRYEELMAAQEFHVVMTELEEFFRLCNSSVTARMSALKDDASPEVFAQAVVDSAHLVKTAAVLAHPIAPQSSETVREYFNCDERFFSWDFIFKPVSVLMEAGHSLKFVEPRFDFYKKPEWQFERR
ncbi:MAG: class I tRNA ligase family protein [Firmicutes bacterium]|nr:class I tRNA ligase family protein [Bacillota bacterium]